MSIKQDYIDLNNIIEEFLFNRAEDANIFSTLIDSDSLAKITDNKFKIFIKNFKSFLLHENNHINIIKIYPYLFVVMQTYIISEVSCKDNRSFYEKFNSECGVCEEDLTDIFEDCQEEIWENIKIVCDKKGIKFFIPERKSYSYRYIQYPISQIILSSEQMNKLLYMLDIRPENKETNRLSLNDFLKIVESNKDIKLRIRDMVYSNKYEDFYRNQYYTISNQLYSYYLTKYFPYQIIKRKKQVINKKQNNVIHEYTMTILNNRIDFFKVSKNSKEPFKNIQKIFMSKSNDNRHYSLWYKAYDEENWTYTNVIYKKYCNYCFLCINMPENFAWIENKLLVIPKVMGRYLLAFLDSEQIKRLIELDYAHTDKWFEFEYPIITGGKKIGRATYLEGFGPKINYTTNSLLLINGLKVLRGDYLLDAKSGFYTIHLFINNHYIKTSINIIASDKQQSILDNSYDDQYIYEIGYEEPPKNIMENNPNIELTINNTSKDFLYTIIGKKTHKNSSLIKVMRLINYGNK